VGWACSTYEARICVHGQGFGKDTLREKDHLEDPGVDGRIILR